MNGKSERFISNLLEKVLGLRFKQLLLPLLQQVNRHLEILRYEEES